MLTQKREGVVTVGNGVDMVASALEEQQVRAEQIYLVVDPQDALGSDMHGRKLNPSRMPVDAGASRAGLASGPVKRWIDG